MDILENRDEWLAGYQSGWLKHYEETGEFNWKLYQPPRNSESVGLPGIDLSQSKLLFISTAGGYVTADQEPFDAPHPLGDYTIRLVPTDTKPSDITFAHTHYDHTAVDADQQVLVPSQHLADLVADGTIGSLTDSWISFMGYQPDATRVIDEMIPEIINAAHQLNAEAALLVPA